MTKLNVAEMGKVELRIACKENGVKNYGKMNNEQMREAIIAATVVEAVEIVEELKAPTPTVKQSMKVGKEILDIELTNVKPIEGKTNHFTAQIGKVELRETDLVKKHGIARPKTDGVCLQIWNTCDTLVSSGITPTLKAIKEQGKLNNWDKVTTTVQFYRWRKFNGISGRVKG